MKLSLIIVNYNTESYIRDLLQDLMAQTLPTDQWQVVIVNNSQNDKHDNTDNIWADMSDDTYAIYDDNAP